MTTVTESPQGLDSALLADEENPGAEGIPAVARMAGDAAADSSLSWLQTGSSAPARESRATVDECISPRAGAERADMSLDTYNMFYLADLWSQAFFYALFIFVTKFALYFLIMIDFRNHRDILFHVDVETPIIIAQLVLMPVAIVMQEELLTSFFIFSHLLYSPSIRKRHPGAYKWKFAVAQFARFLDGAVFLFINVAVMLSQQTDVLGLFLNFAALMFLSDIDNVALKVCLDGYWTQALQDTAQDVVDMKFAYKNTETHRHIQTAFVVLTFVAYTVLWWFVHF